MSDSLLEKNKVEIKYGKPIFNVTFHALTFMYSLVIFILGCSLLLAASDIYSAIYLLIHFGYVINMVSNDGNLLPILQAIPAIIYFLINLTQAYLVIKIFDPSKEQHNKNRMLFTMIITSLGLLILILIVILIVLADIYKSHSNVENRLLDRMSFYSNNSLVKTEIDIIQIEMDCCGSKKYDDWYNISWNDKSVATKNMTDKTNGNTPFSCCSKKSLFPCIHHDIENTGTAYLYAPERNLSISTIGCFESIMKSKKKFGLNIIYHLMLFAIVQISANIILRFLQTAHFSTNAKFDGQKLIYTIWLVGMYRGRIMVSDNAPDPPPLPQELMD